MRKLLALALGFAAITACSPGTFPSEPVTRAGYHTDSGNRRAQGDSLITTFSFDVGSQGITTLCSGYNVATGQCESIAAPFSATPVVSKIFAKIPACPGAGFITVDGVDFRIAGLEGPGSNSPTSGLGAGAVYWLDNGTTDGHGNGVFIRSWVLTDDQRADEKVWINTWRPLDSQKNCP